MPEGQAEDKSIWAGHDLVARAKAAEVHSVVQCQRLVRAVDGLWCHVKLVVCFGRPCGRWTTYRPNIRHALGPPFSCTVAITS